jgi:hypothetical protein
MKKVHGVLEELLRTQGYYHNDGIFKELALVVLTWHTKSSEEKCKLAYKHLCHEFNFFQKMKDNHFFESTVRPLIQCKMEKTFVDHYLLDEYETINRMYNNLESKLLFLLIIFFRIK